MAPDLFPFSPSESRSAFNSRRWWSSLRSNGTVKFVFFSTVFLSTSLIVYLTFYSSDSFSWHLPDWHLPSDLLSDPQTLTDLDGPIVDSKLGTVIPNLTSESTIPNDPPPPQSSSPISDVLTLEQIRDIVAPTRGFFSRDFSLGLGWNNVSDVYCQVYIN